MFIRLFKIIVKGYHILGRRFKSTQRCHKLVVSKRGKPKCRLLQVIILGKNKVDPQGMIKYKRIIFIIMQNKKLRKINLTLVSTRKWSKGIKYELKSKLRN